MFGGALHQRCVHYVQISAADVAGVTDLGGAQDPLSQVPAIATVNKHLACTDDIPALIVDATRLIGHAALLREYD